MRRALGQAVRAAGGRLALLGRLLLAALLLLLAAAGALAWRLDQGPLPLPWVAHRIEAAAARRGIPLSMAQASLAWAGFSRGIGAPLRLALTGLRVAGVQGERVAAAPPVQAAAVAADFSPAALLSGQFVPSGIAVDGLRLILSRDVRGRLALGSPPAPGPGLDRLRPAAAPGGGRGGPGPDWRLLRHLHVHDVAAALYDAPLGLSWEVTRADADLDRAADGRLGGQAVAAMRAGAQHATLRLTAQQQNGGSAVQAQLTRLDPAALAALTPGFADLAALDAPVGLSATAELDDGFGLLHAHLAARIGAGTVHAGSGDAPLLAATLAAEVTPSTVDATQRLETAPSAAGPRTVVTGTLHAARAATGWTATEAATVDRVAFADLPVLWPAGIGGPGTRPWITQNIPLGELTGGRLSMTLAIPPDFSDVALTAIDGAIDGHDLTVRWLSPVPPIEHAEGRLTITDPDVIDIAITSAREARPAAAGPPADGIAFSQGHVRLTGIAGNDQFADITTQLAGSLPDLLAVLKNPRIKLLDKRPIPMRDPAGSLSASLSVLHLPLRDDVAMEDLQIATRAHLSGVHLGGIAAGRDLDRGVLDLTADNDGLHVKGSAALAGIASQLEVAMDFRAGPPSQVQQQVTVRASVDARQLERLGLPARGVLGGSLLLDATLRDRRDGHADIAAHADLTAASLDAGRLAWSKPLGRPVTARLHVSLDHDRLTSIDDIVVRGPGVDVEGAADFAGGQPQLLRLNRLVLAPDTDARGSVRLPRVAGEPYVVNLAGASLDASGVLKQSTGTPPPDAQQKQPPKAPEKPGPPWVLDAQLGKVVLGPSRLIEDLSAHAEDDGRVVRAALVTGVAQSVAPVGARHRASPFRLSLAPEPGGRRLTASAPDAGGLLRALDIARDISGGRMEVAAHYDDTQASHPLTGTATLHEFRVLNAPVIGRVLQAATLYGLIEVLRGPGLGFSTMVAPFRWEDDRLTLDNARAYSASLGFTAKGQVELAASRLDVQGTIVPAYFFNALPGRIPLLGKLFSPERGGGLFAATYRVRGSFDDPHVGVNPLATLTPGFLRGVFGIFGNDGKAAGRAP